jgi:putative Holliday junction resolvase
LPGSTAEPSDRVLAIDFGTKRLGFAVGDELGARPLETWTRRDEAQDLARVRAHVEAYAIDRVVVGRPTMLDGRTSPATDRADAFREALAAALERPVEPWDEALTSWAADARMEEADLPRAKRKAWRDAYAALILLEDYLTAAAARVVPSE